jgi:hypothetical protein
MNLLLVVRSSLLQATMVNRLRSRTNFLELPSASVARISFARNVTVTDVISVIAAF